MLTREQKDLLLLQRILRNFDAICEVTSKVAAGMIVAALEARYDCENAKQCEAKLLKLVEGE